VLVLCSYSARSQDARAIIQIVDATDRHPISRVQISRDGGSLLSITDTGGYAVVSLPVLESVKYLVVTAPGYKIDTVLPSVTSVYMQRLKVELPEATISSGRAKRLFSSETEYVVDYGFDNDKIIALTYSGYNGRRGKAILMNSSGTEISRVSLSSAPFSFFRSCVGVNYCVAEDGFYRLDVGEKRLSLPAKYESRMLPALQQCECATNGNLYYRVSDRRSFTTVYGMVEKGDSSFRPFKSFAEPKVARASYMELLDIINLLEHYQFSEAARRAHLRKMWDDGTLSHISLPVFICENKLIIFDYDNKQLLHFDLHGDVLKTAPINFAWKHSQQFEMIQDELSGKLYVHRYDSKEKHLLQELDVNSASIVSTYAIEKPFIEKLKIRGGKVYYLWQDQAAHKTQQLYVQEMNQVN